MPELPTDLPAERSTLGAVLLDREAILLVADALTPDDFYLERHGRIYAAMLACLGRRVPPDLATVAGELARSGDLDHIGGVSMLADLVAETPTAVHVEYYARQVAEAAARRRLIQAGGQITVIGYDQALDLPAALDAAEQRLYAVAAGRQRADGFVSMASAAQGYLDDASRPEDDDPPAPTGILDLDALLGGGLRGGQLALLAARPSMGKSGLALSIAYHLGAERRQRVGVVSLEMSEREIVDRLVAMRTGRSTQDVAARRRAGDSEIIAALAALSEATIYIAAPSDMTLMDIRSQARRLATAAPLDLLIVDYLQLITPAGREQNREQEIAKIARGLKNLAREIDAPVLALSQMSRAVEQRASKLPLLSDLRESGSLEQDADIVLFIHREEVEGEEQRGRAGPVELHLAKHRGGPLGVVPCYFQAPTTRFLNLNRREARR